MTTLRCSGLNLIARCGAAAASPLSADDYHLDFSRDSHSSLQLFRASIAEYAAIRVFQTLPQQEPTPEMIIGSAFHAFILEPEAFGDRYVPKPAFDRRTKQGKEDYSAWLRENVGKTELASEDFDLLAAMAEGLRSNARARACIEVSGEAERVLTWDDPKTGCPLKMRADRILDGGLIVDLKTTSDVRPESFAKTVHNLGYYRQAALYQAGVKHAIGLDVDVLFVAVSKRPPHETACFLLDAEAMRFGQKENDDTLRELADRRARNDWASRLHGQNFEISLPRWAFK